MPRAEAVKKLAHKDKVKNQVREWSEDKPEAFTTIFDHYRTKMAYPSRHYMTRVLSQSLINYLTERENSGRDGWRADKAKNPAELNRKEFLDATKVFKLDADGRFLLSAKKVQARSKPDVDLEEGVDSEPEEQADSEPEEQVEFESEGQVDSEPILEVVKPIVLVEDWYTVFKELHMSPTGIHLAELSPLRHTTLSMALA
jgi:hypothetical protein